MPAILLHFGHRDIFGGFLPHALSVLALALGLFGMKAEPVSEAPVLGGALTSLTPSSLPCGPGLRSSHSFYYHQSWEQHQPSRTGLPVAQKAAQKFFPSIKTLRLEGGVRIALLVPLDLLQLLYFPGLPPWLRELLGY